MHSCNKPVREPRSTLPVCGEPLPILWTELDVPARVRNPGRFLGSLGKPLRRTRRANGRAAGGRVRCRGNDGGGTGAQGAVRGACTRCPRWLQHRQTGAGIRHPSSPAPVCRRMHALHHMQLSRRALPPPRSRARLDGGGGPDGLRSMRDGRPTLLPRPRHHLLHQLHPAQGARGESSRHMHPSPAGRESAREKQRNRPKSRFLPHKRCCPAATRPRGSRSGPSR